MPGTARQVWRIRRLLLVLCLLLAPALDALDGDVEDVQFMAAETGVASPEKHVPLAGVPNDPVPHVMRRPLLCTPGMTPPTWRPPITHPVRCRLSPCVKAGATDADADPA